MDYEKIQPIIDLFPCLQGEGMYVGVPHILIRLSGCNLRCAFKGSLCDTAYSSWNPEQGKYSLQDVINVISQNPQIANILITGGEPTLNLTLLRDLINIARKAKKKVTIETNGTVIKPDVLGKGHYPDLISISPKLSSSIPTGEFQQQHESRRENIPAIVSWIRFAKRHQLKYVVSTDDDIREVQDQVSRIALRMIDEGVSFPRLTVYLMPEGDTEEKLKEKRRWLAKKCVELGYFYTDRLHIIIFGTEREA